ncbi:MAG: fructosamine kinase family protein [Methylococcales bacterium]|nr:fructosamine kinase family protein [Methylococcales bacterium]
MIEWSAISQQIRWASGQDFVVEAAQPLSGGDINDAYRLQGKGKTYFIKLNRADQLAMFTAEMDGLLAIANTHTLRVPTPMTCGQTSKHSFLVLEYLEFGSANKASERLLGQQLALMHQQPQPYFGWHRDNTIGITPQPNKPNTDWLAFWRDQRLANQLQLAAHKGYGGKLQTYGERLCSDMDGLFIGYKPQASLLHGDLWAGNAAVDKQGCPLVFDPACYNGDREADLAMTELFGGYGADFYAAYQAVWPVDQGYGLRKDFYNVYHLLNHLNLFGGGYARQAENKLGQLIASLR